MSSELIGILAGVATIAGGIFAMLKWGDRFVRWIWTRLTRHRSRVPRETVRIVPRLRGPWWSQGSVSGKPAMQIVANWHATNITGEPVRLLTTRLQKPRTEGSVFIEHPAGGEFGDYPILPGQTADVMTNYWITPPIRQPDQDFKATVYLVDQFGNDHKIKNVVFKAPPPRKEEAQQAFEPLHKIGDPIEKEVAAVLKSEINRYQECGRRVGGLGSIRTTIQGRTYSGLGTEWREADSAKNQSIEFDGSGVRIESDNLQALLNLHQGLPDAEEKRRFESALLGRLVKNAEYSSVAYLILLVLFELGSIEAALSKAQADLRGDEKLGFDEFLRLIDGLLRFRHSSFSSKALDDVERFAIDSESHSFKITERISAIRAHRLASQE